MWSAFQFESRTCFNERGAPAGIARAGTGAIHTPAVEKTLGGVETIIADLPPEGGALYGEAMRRMARTFASNERAGSPPEIVAEVVERALTDRSPRTRYPAGKDSVKLALLARFLPEKLLDIAVLKTFGLGTSAR